MGTYMGVRANSLNETEAETITHAPSETKALQVDTQHLAEHEKQELNDE